MKEWRLPLCLVGALLMVLAGSAGATSMTAYPWMVPDESVPRGNLGDAPSGWGTSSWQGPSAGKSNFHIRFNADGSYWNQLFGDTPVTVGELSSLSYWTKKGVAIPTSRDWWMTIYTAPEGDSDDKGSWFRNRLHGNYASGHASDDTWRQYTTADGSLKFSDNFRNYGTYYDLSDFASGNPNGWDYSGETVMSITIQTDSGWNGFDGFVDGIDIGLSDSRMGSVDLSAVPEPSTVVLLGIVGSIGAIAAWRRRSSRS